MARPDQDHWRDLKQLLDEPGDAQLPYGMSRREFVKLLGASMALAGIGGCLERPRERILPYVSDQPEAMPTRAVHYATAMTLGGYATGLLVESHEGRPTKVEGNPDHPASLGASGVYEQASLLQLYDPDRARAIRLDRRGVTWEQMADRLSPGRLEQVAGARGSGLRVLLEPTASPVIADLLRQLVERYPAAQVRFYSPLSFSDKDAATVAAFGRPLSPQYDFRRADVVLALDADFLGGMPFSLRYAHDFAERRRIRTPNDGAMNRLYVAEPGLTVTGGRADHRLRLRAAEIESLLAAVLLASPRLGTGVELPQDVSGAVMRLASGTRFDEWAGAVARDLGGHRGRSIVIAGERQPARVHLLAHLANAVLGNIGATVGYIEPPIIQAGRASHGLAPLVEEMRSGAVGALLMVGGNPAYTAPADLDFSGALGKVPFAVYHGPYDNETARQCGGFIPSLHYLESWADGCAYDGTPSLVQPLIAPLYGGKADSEILSALLGTPQASAHSLLQRTWRDRLGTAGFDQAWNDALQRGMIGTGAPRVAPRWQWDRVRASLASTEPEPRRGLELVFDPDPCVHDGRFGNNVWLQELPDPVTKLTWGNAASLSPTTAQRLKLANGDLVNLSYRGRQIRTPVLIQPGQADDTVLVRLGYGREAPAETAAHGVGVNAYRLLDSHTPLFGAAVDVARSLEADEAPLQAQLASTQKHWALNGRPIALRSSLADYHRNPNFTRAERGRALSLYQPAPAHGDQWAMVIDLGTCTGCSACVVACQAENNIPVVGKKGVMDGREMHWLRIDRYFEGTPEDPVVLMQPMLCQHCEKAPCEYVCPVGATAHSPDGLNEMAYNRCVGTRFCSNNCPYKVRRFNWFNYNAELAETERMVKNPDVTVRGRGVMEKCTFCVQRIREAQIEAAVEGSGRTGQVRTACQQACPTQAIAFGSLNQPDSEVVRRRGEPRCYAALNELGTEPRVQYLADITNPNVELEHGGRG